MTLDKMIPGERGIIEKVGGEGELRDRLLDMGLTPGTLITFRKAAPMGDPIQLTLRGYELTIRCADAARIEVAKVDEKSIDPFRLSHGCASCAAKTKCSDNSFSDERIR